MAIEYENPEKEVLEKFNIPLGVKYCVTLIATLILAVSGYAIINYIFGGASTKGPNQIGASGLIIFSLSSLAIVWIPWRELGISKIGGLEFRDIVEGQASEHAEEIAYLQERIEILESQISGVESGSLAIKETTDFVQDDKLDELLLDFLGKHARWSFSPSRILAWGSNREGFESLSKYNKYEIRYELQKLVMQNKLVTRVSQKGNTLYTVPKDSEVVNEAPI